MASNKVVFVALVLVALVAVAAAAGESGRTVPLRRAEQSLGWMNGLKGGPPSGMQPSVTTATIPERPTMIGEEGAGGEGEGKFIAPVPSFNRPVPRPPSAP
ncbi:hypothetical protein ACQ4PT_050190 [Festuca glaucescens]